MEGRFNGGFFALPVWGAYTPRGLFPEFYGTDVNFVCHDDQGNDDDHDDTMTSYVNLAKISSETKIKTMYVHRTCMYARPRTVTNTKL